ncbi:MAG TPA: OpgC domain-containing protein [Steroidobacteraceae bacterium]|nr:OpgC domain-containing protein [Steroidobacteraceae bacterium]
MNRVRELDALRGILLLVMATTHLPTALNAYVDQPLGYVSSAEGFVFLSAFLVGSLYTPMQLTLGAGKVRRKLWARAWRLYGFHLALLAFTFTVVAGMAVLCHNQALHNYLRFFFDAPGPALVAAPLLRYQPPLLDILPMYIVLLALTPLVLERARRRGWAPLLLLSGLLWLCAQLQASRWFGRAEASVGLVLPNDAWSAFDWLAWQLVWMGGLWLGSRRPRPQDAAPAGAPASGLTGRHWLVAAAFAATLLFLCLRHHLGDLPVSLDVNGALADKWKLGPLRIVNFAALAVVVQKTLLPALRWLRIGVLELLGRNSLYVFIAHIPVCVMANGLVDVLGHALRPSRQAVLLALLFAVMLAVAWRMDGSRRSRRGSAAAARAVLEPQGTGG